MMLDSVAKMQHSLPMLTAAQIRAARGFLDWKQSDLAKTSGIAEVTIKKIERGGIDPRASTLEALQRAFNKAGLLFLEPGDVRDGGAGLRFAKKGRRP
jgi:predicted transcriptional regulator